MEKDPEWVSNMDEIEAVTLEKHISISRSSLEIVANFSHVVLTLTFVVLGNLQFRAKRLPGCN